MRVRELRVSYHPTDQIHDARTRLTTPAQCAIFLRPWLEHEASEVFLILLLDTKLRPIAVHTVSRGSLDSTLVHPREVFKAAFLGNAASIVTAHNHPSGDPNPSPDDLVLFDRLNKAGEILGIETLDHLIIGELNTFTSRRLA